MWPFLGKQPSTASSPNPALLALRLLGLGKCFAKHEWPIWWSHTAALITVTKVRSGPNARLCKVRSLRKAAIPSGWLLPAQSRQRILTRRAETGHSLRKRASYWTTEKAAIQNPWIRRFAALHPRSGLSLKEKS